MAPFPIPLINAPSFDAARHAEQVKSLEFQRRRGTFRIATTVLMQDIDAYFAAVQGCVIIRAERLYVPDVMEYMALSMDFDVCKDDEIAPRYQCDLVVHVDPNGERHFTRPFWVREMTPRPAPGDDNAA